MIHLEQIAVTEKRTQVGRLDCCTDVLNPIYMIQPVVIPVVQPV